MSVASWVLLLSTVGAEPAPPEDPAAVLRRAETLYASDRFGEAEPLLLEAARSTDPFVKRRAYEKLMALYVRSGRQDKAIQLGTPFRVWLKDVGDAAATSELDLMLGECYLGLGYLEKADNLLTAAIAGGNALTEDRRMQALRCRAEIASQRRDPEAAKRWGDLEALAREVNSLAERTVDTALRVSSIRYLAEALNRKGEPDAALTVLAPVPELLDRMKDPIGRRDVQRQRANLLASRGKFDEAQPLFQEALDLHRKNRIGRHMMAGDILAEWGMAMQAAGRKPEAIKLREQATVEYRAVLDATAAEDPDGGGPLAAFAKLQALTRSARQFRKALDLSRDAAERWSGDRLIDARLKSDQGGLELLTTSYQTARKLLSDALADLDASQPPDLRAMPHVLVNLATAELACDSRDQADKHLLRCAELYRDNKLVDDPVRAECEYLRGVAASQRGDFAQAMKFFRAGLAVCDGVGKPAESVRFNLWLNTALIHKEQGDVSAAQDSLKQAAAALAGFADADDLSFALIDAVRADLHISQGKVLPAMALIPTVEAACKKNNVHGGYLWTTARHVRALEKMVQKDTKAAAEIWTELAAVQRKENQLLLARTLNFLGVASELQGREADAIKFFEEAREFQVSRPRCGPVTQAITYWRLAVLAEKAGKHEEAKKLIATVFDVADKARLNTFGEAAQRATFFAQFAPAFELSAHWAARDNDGEALLRVASRSRSRTLLDQVLAAGVDPRANLAGPDRERLLAQETTARRAVSSLRARIQLLPADKPDDPTLKQAMADLEKAQQDYADAWREIVNADPVTRVLTDPSFADKSLAKLRKDAIEANALLLSYVIGRDESYAVLTGGPDAKPEIFKLTIPKVLADKAGEAPQGEASTQAGLRGILIRPTHKQPDRPAALVGPSVPLSRDVAARLVDQYLLQIADPDFSATRGIAIVTKDADRKVLPTTGEALGDSVLPPALLQRIRALKAKRLIVIPDGALHKIPLECLLVSSTGPKPRYALDELPAICYAPSPAILSVIMARPRNLEGPPTLLTVGDPSYEVYKIASPQGPPGSAPQFVNALPPLPFTAEESRRIRDFFPAGSVTALEKTAATEKNVLAAIHGKRFIHLAAHGFADAAFGNLFAAIALSPPKKGDEAPENDGFLSLHEIYRLKLTGCELTVLSACITYVGPQRPLEAGVTLAGAFLCSGSRGVMASCWSVDDQATAELMGEFFKAVKPGEPGSVSYADALKAARQTVRSKPGWESPFYWAPFVFVGPPN